MIDIAAFLKAAGMTVIGFCGGSHCQPAHADVLRDHGASACIQDMRDLIPLLG